MCVHHTVIVRCFRTPLPVLSENKRVFQMRGQTWGVHTVLQHTSFRCKLSKHFEWRALQRGIWLVLVAVILTTTNHTCMSLHALFSFNQCRMNRTWTSELCQCNLWVRKHIFWQPLVKTNADGQSRLKIWITVLITWVHKF